MWGVGDGAVTQKGKGGEEGKETVRASLLEVPGPWLGGEGQAGLGVEKKGGKKGVPGVWNSMSKG